MPDFVFRELDHTYWLGACQLAGTTDVLKSVGLIYQGASEFALDRGSKVHLACKLLVEGRLDWSSVDPRIMGYVLSYQEFLNHTQWAARAAEVSLYDGVLLFAGTFDVDFTSDFLFDLKTSGPAKWHALQTAAYHHLHGGRGKRGTLYLQADGSMPKLVEHKDRADWPNFVSCLNVYRLKENGNGSR